MDKRTLSLDSRSDEKLLASHLQGDSEAFSALVRRYQRDLYHFLLRFLADPVAADDVFQETFLQVFQSAHTFEPGRTFRPWLFAIAANKARDYLRSKVRKQTISLQTSNQTTDEAMYHQLVQTSEQKPTSHLEEAELQHLVNATIQRLPQHLREIILLAYFHQMTYRQIAEVLDLPLGTVKSRLHTAVETFAILWKSANPSPD